MAPANARSFKHFLAYASKILQGIYNTKLSTQDPYITCKSWISVLHEKIVLARYLYITCKSWNSVLHEKIVHARYLYHVLHINNHTAVTKTARDYGVSGCGFEHVGGVTYSTDDNHSFTFHTVDKKTKNFPVRV